jgi:hypothetical protein
MMSSLSFPKIIPGLPMMQSEIVVGYPEMAEPFYGKRAIAQ